LKFLSRGQVRPEIMERHMVAGDFDYLLKIGIGPFSGRDERHPRAGSKRDGDWHGSQAGPDL